MRYNRAAIRQFKLSSVSQLLRENPAFRFSSPFRHAAEKYSLQTNPNIYVARKPT